MKSDDEWVNLVKGILRAEMTRRGITYDQLAAKLRELGVQEYGREHPQQGRALWVPGCVLCAVPSRDRMPDDTI